MNFFLVFARDTLLQHGQNLSVLSDRMRATQDALRHKLGQRLQSVATACGFGEGKKGKKGEEL